MMLSSFVSKTACYYLTETSTEAHSNEWSSLTHVGKYVPQTQSSLLKKKKSVKSKNIDKAMMNN